MKMSIYIETGILKGEITEESMECITKWFRGKGKDIFCLNDSGLKRYISRKHVSLIEFQ